MSFDFSGWPVPNYKNPETRGPEGRIIGITLMSLGTILLVLRLYTRQFISHNFGLDDILLVLSYIPAVAYSTLGIYAEMFLQWDRHTWDIVPSLFTPSLKAALVEVALFDISTSLTKLSLLATIYRMTSCSKDGKMSLAVKILAALISINGVSFIFITIFQCNPVYSYWNLSRHKNCINEGIHVLIAGNINTVTDFILVFLPMKLVLNLGLPRRQKYIAIGLFAAGLLASVAGVIRTVYTMSMFDQNDRIWNGWMVQLASSIELFLGIICACIPTIKLFFETYLVKAKDAISRSSRSAFHHKATSTADKNWSKSVITELPASTTHLIWPLPQSEMPMTSPRVPPSNPGFLSPSTTTDQQEPNYVHSGSFSSPLAYHPVNLNKELPPIRETHHFYLQLD